MLTVVPGAGDYFVVARNPDPDTTLPYLLRLPIPGGMELKAKAPWPTTARVYCHPVDGWPDEAETLEEVRVKQCVRRGRAIDLVLDRGQNNRSQFVFTEPHPGRYGGRPMIFWQTARTARRARPGQRAPVRRATRPGTLIIDVDSRERYGYRFAGRDVECRRSALRCGDYAVRDGDRVIAAVERKTLEDYVGSLLDGAMPFAMAELSSLPKACVVIEARYSQVLAWPRVQPGWLAELTSQLYVRYPGVPIAFCDSRKLAEDFTYRFLAAATADLGAVASPPDHHGIALTS
jgi:hypothetical protein